MRDLKRAIKRAVKDGARNVNVAHRTNVVIAGSVGEPGSVHAVSVKQHAPITQRPEAKE